MAKMLLPINNEKLLLVVKCGLFVANPIVLKQAQCQTCTEKNPAIRVHITGGSTRLYADDSAS